MIHANDLTFTYSSAKNPAVTGLNFDIQKGEIFGFLGPSGAGKSTTQKILINLLRNYQGIITIFGRNLSSWNSDFYERIGVSFEMPNHYLKLTAKENLTYFGSLYSRQTRKPQELLDIVGLGNDGKMPVAQYSKGMKNRLNVARALLNHPELLFLDEPTAGLDPVNAKRIKDIILEEKRAGKTIFLTTHDMMVADQLCDRVAFIVDGKITLTDTPRNLKLQYGKPTIRIEYLTDGYTEHQDFPLNNIGENSDFLNALKAHTLQTIHSQEATLEDIFIQATGRIGYYPPSAWI